MSKKIVTIEKKQKIEKRSRLAKKAIIFLVVALSVVAVTAMTVFAAGGAVDTTDFIK